MSSAKNGTGKPTTLDNGTIKRIYGQLCKECRAGGYVEVSYATLARRVHLPWFFMVQKNLDVIVGLRRALRTLEAARLISVKPATHTSAFVKLRNMDYGGGARR